VKIEKVIIGRRDALTIKMRAGGGFVARFDFPGSGGGKPPFLT
jgi:hypothetical protein